MDIENVTANEVGVVTPQVENNIESQKDAIESTEQSNVISDTNVNSTAKEVDVVEPQKQREQEETITKVVAKRLSEEKTKAEMKARDALIAEMFEESLGIKTYDEYIEAKKEAEIREKYENRDLPPEIIDEIVENKKFREKFETEKSLKEQEEKVKKEHLEFLELFKQLNNKEFDSEKDTIPQEVFDEVQKGISLKQAYSDYHKEIKIKQLEKELEEFKKGKITQELNEDNSKTSPSEIKIYNEKELTPEIIDKMSSQEQIKNWQLIKKILKIK